MNQIDYFVVGSKRMNSTSQCRSFWGTFVDSDHAMVVVIVGLKLRSVPKKKLPKRLDISVLKGADVSSDFQVEIALRLNELDNCDTVADM